MASFHVTCIRYFCPLWKVWNVVVSATWTSVTCMCQSSCLGIRQLHCLTLGATHPSLVCACCRWMLMYSQRLRLYWRATELAFTWKDSKRYIFQLQVQFTIYDVVTKSVRVYTGYRRLDRKCLPMGFWDRSWPYGWPVGPFASVHNWARASVCICHW